MLDQVQHGGASEIVIIVVMLTVGPLTIPRASSSLHLSHAVHPFSCLILRYFAVEFL